MNTVLLTFPLILAVSQAASVVPIESSSVNVKHSGSDYSYTIQENHGVAIEPSQITHQQLSIVKSAQIPVAGSVLLNQIGQKVIQHDQKQIHGHVQDQVQTRLMGQKQEQIVRPQEQLKAFNVVIPNIEVVPSNIQFDLTPSGPYYYPYYRYYPNLFRIE